ncbi:MAG: insulinase family protein [Proteobacteria bacterium]|nr:insulinase family protein [Pseudomonadota bacterium]MBU1685974.1 insulinase family protein [Pseudomonadota bacterium]
MYKKTVLDNGVRILSEQLSSRVVAFGIWVDVGARDEDSTNNGSAHFIEHMLFKGTHLRSPGQIAVELDLLGGLGNAFTSGEQTCYHSTVLSSHLERAVGLFADLFLHSIFADDEVERERQVILQEISMVEDTPDDRVHELFSSLIWEGHALGNTVLGLPVIISGQDRTRLIDFQSRGYRPERIVIVAAGDVDHRKFVSLWNALFGRIESNTPALPARRSPPQLQPRLIVDERSLEQIHLVLGVPGLPVSAAQRYALLLLHTILGGNMSSRLFQEIREKRGLAYSVYSYLASYTDSGYLGIYLGVDPGVLRESLALVRHEIHRLLRDPVSSKDLDAAIEYAKCSMFLAVDHMESRMTRLARNELFFGREIPIDEVVIDLEKVTVDEIGALASSLLAGENLFGVAMGPVSLEEFRGSI